jgi:predicted nucleic acid-binding protein
MIRSLWDSAIAIDTSAVRALHDTRDGYHDAARRFWNESKARYPVWVAMNATRHESFTRLRYDLGLRAAWDGDGFLGQPPFQSESFTAEDEVAARSILSRYESVNLSFHDALLGAVLKRLGVGRVFGFDAEFRAMGFELLPY